MSKCPVFGQGPRSAEVAASSGTSLDGAPSRMRPRGWRGGEGCPPAMSLRQALQAASLSAPTADSASSSQVGGVREQRSAASHTLHAGSRGVDEGAGLVRTHGAMVCCRGVLQVQSSGAQWCAAAF